MYGNKNLQYSIKLFCQILSGLILFSTIIYFGACVFLFFYQPRLIFFPSSEIGKRPGNFSLPHQDVWLPVEYSNPQQEYIHGWWMENKKSDGRVLLYLHGNSLNISANISQAKLYYQQGFSVLLIDYRGYGLSQGSFPSESQVYEDAHIAWDYLVQKQQISPSKIFIYGHSLGGAIAIDLAVKCPQASGLIVESSFTSIQEMIEHQRNIFSIFPVDWILTQRFDSINKVPNLKMPVLFIHGALDNSVPSYMSKKLYETAPSPKHLVIIDDAQHNDVSEVATPEYIESINYFLKLTKIYK
ncbi:MAG: alpha/beta fold hydrolase [Cyanobacteria bacterium P01_A01_bin.45]